MSVRGKRVKDLTAEELRSFVMEHRGRIARAEHAITRSRRLIAGAREQLHELSKENRRKTLAGKRGS